MIVSVFGGCGSVDKMMDAQKSANIMAKALEPELGTLPTAGVRVVNGRVAQVNVSIDAAAVNDRTVAELSALVRQAAKDHLDQMPDEVVLVLRVPQ